MIKVAKHGDGLGYEIVKAVISGEIIEPITLQKVKDFCERSGIQASDNHIRVTLSNATVNTHSPTYKVFFERVGRGEYQILPKYGRPRKYYWLNVDSKAYNWAFSIVKVGSSQSYSNFNPDGSKRKMESCFKSIKTGDLVLAYETGKTKAITAICQVVDKYQKNNEIIVEFQKSRDFNVYLNLDNMREINTLNDCDIINNHRGTLLELEERHFDLIVKKLEALNFQVDYHEEQYRMVQKSIADGKDIRRERLENRTTVIPEAYEIVTRMFNRNPDVIAEVLLKANGICEKCKKTAPFIRASDGTPYLEVHHTVRLADGGVDTIDNAIAVCPNCHRELHFGLK